MTSIPPQLPPGFEGSLAQSLALDGVARGPAASSSLGRQWSALHRAAAAVASLGGVDMAAMSPELAEFPSRVESLSDWRAGLARQGIADLAAVMEPGLTALIAVHRRGADPTPAAQALLQEFTNSRNALLGMARDRD